MVKFEGTGGVVSVRCDGFEGLRKQMNALRKQLKGELQKTPTNLQKIKSRLQKMKFSGLWYVSNNQKR